jgi:hypothetical protein
MSTDISELFDRDPVHLTNADIDLIILRQREAQTQHELGVKAAPKARAAPAKAAKTLDLLKDLGLI